jgi:replication factor A2
MDKKRRSYDEQTLIPVTIGMVNKAHMDVSSGDGTLVLEDGRPLHTIKLIAAVRSIEDMSTNVWYQIEDGTGLMDMKQWLDDNDSSVVMEMRKETTKDGIYIKVIGQVKDYEGQKMIVANSVHRISTGNELTHHMLEVIYSAESLRNCFRTTNNDTTNNDTTNNDTTNNDTTNNDTTNNDTTNNDTETH